MSFGPRGILITLILAHLFLGASLHAASSEPQKHSSSQQVQGTLGDMISNLIHSTGLWVFLTGEEGKSGKGKTTSTFHITLGRVMMMGICLFLLYLGIAHGFEPLLLLPIGFGGLLANIPIAGIAEADGLIGILYHFGIENGLFPLLIFMGVGALTDFGPLLANPVTALLGGAAQFGIFTTLIGAICLSQYTSVFHFSLSDAAAIGIIGGADGPTAIFLASRLAPELLGAIAVAAYSYMALVPIIQPPIIRFMTTVEERKVRMQQMRAVSRTEKVLFPVTIVVLCILLLPNATPLVGALMFGNLIRESQVAERLSDTLQNSLINIVTIFLGLSVGSKLASDKFLVPETLGILVLGLLAFGVGTATGILMAKALNRIPGLVINPILGAAGVSAVPMAARVVSREGQREDPGNQLLMHAMGPNVSGVIGSAVAAGVLLSIFQ